MCRLGRPCVQLQRNMRPVEELAWVASMLSRLDGLQDVLNDVKHCLYERMANAAVDQLDDHGASTSDDAGSSPASGTNELGPVEDKPDRLSKHTVETWADDRGHSLGNAVQKP